MIHWCFTIMLCCFRSMLACVMIWYMNYDIMMCYYVKAWCILCSGKRDYECVNDEYDLKYGHDLYIWDNGAWFLNGRYMVLRRVKVVSFRAYWHFDDLYTAWSFFFWILIAWLCCVDMLTWWICSTCVAISICDSEIWCVLTY